MQAALCVVIYRGLKWLILVSYESLISLFYPIISQDALKFWFDRKVDGFIFSDVDYIFESSDVATALGNRRRRQVTGGADVTAAATTTPAATVPAAAATTRTTNPSSEPEPSSSPEPSSEPEPTGSSGSESAPVGALLHVPV